MYKVLQGKMSSRGCGDIEVVAEFREFEDALYHFNLVKEDTNGWCISRKAHEYLETWLVNEADEILEVHKF